MQLRDARVLITGASGFIGSHVARACVNVGADVACLLRPASDSWRLLEEASQIKRYDADLRDEAVVRRAFTDFRPDVVFHLAAFIKRTRELDQYESQHEANALSTLHLVRAAIGTPSLKRFIHTSTIEEYGRNEVPFKESQRENPVTLYSLTKYESTRLTLYACQEQGLPATILRLPLVYGPLQGGHMFIPGFIRAALTTKTFDMSPGEQTRDFLHVDDAARAYLVAATAENVNGEIFNVATGVETKLKGVAERLRALFGNEVDVQYGARPCDPNIETMRCFMDITKINCMLAWQPNIDLDSGLRQTVDWYTAHASTYEHLWD